MRNHILFFAVLLLVFASCGNADFSKQMATADSTQFPSNITNPTSPSRKILHTADISYRVKDVLTATTAAEQLAKSLGGLVVKSEMHNERVSVRDIPYKADSVKQAQVYTPEAAMTVIVPVLQMDSFIAVLSANAQFVAHRTIAQQDMTYTYLTNALKNQLTANGDLPGQYAPPAADANTILTEKIKQRTIASDQAIDRKIANLQLLEESEYATLSINFTEAEQVETFVKADAVYAMRTPYTLQLAAALNTSIDLLRNLLLIIVQLWPLEALAIMSWLVYKRYRKIPARQQAPLL